MILSCVCSLYIFLHKYFNDKDKYSLCGDINIDFSIESRTRDELINLFLEFNIKHHINEPTRVTNSSQTCIDNIFLNHTTEIIKVRDSFLSDHTY